MTKYQLKCSHDILIQFRHLLHTSKATHSSHYVLNHLCLNLKDCDFLCGALIISVNNLF